VDFRAHFGGLPTAIPQVTGGGDNPFELVTKRVSRTFFVELFNYLDLPDVKCLRLVIISPWITEFADDHMPTPTLEKLVRYRDRLGIFKAVTRNPRKTFPAGHRTLHEDGVRVLKEAGADLVFLDGLHTKLLGTELLVPVSPGRRVTDTVTLFGSANLTLRSQYNIELGLRTKSIGWGEVLNRELFELAQQLYVAGKRETGAASRRL